MDIDNFVEKQETTVNKYQRIYKIIDLTIITLTLFTILKLLNIDLFILTFRALELYADSTYGPSGMISAGGLLLAAISILFAIILTFAFHYRDRKVLLIPFIEERFPALQERLRTAFDNRDVHNVISDDLMGNVLDVASKIDNSKLIEKKRLKNSMFLLLAVFIMFTTINVLDYRTDVTPEDINDLIGEIPGISSGENETSPDEQFPLEGEEGDSGGNSEDLVGETAIIVVEGEEVDLSLPPGAGTGFTESGDEESLPPDFESSSEYERKIMSSPAYYEQLPEGYESIIKEYFEQMANN
ncbi:DUF7502 family protein [Methanococcoides burtonii]|uniref:Uncharacterized protein n=1 Tax=Methanococcoides burtonii (strain DSM 6242 / NBRC 107633 / OCM 468 / ACE-M) TaxID=259564 RepID=Q12XR5_METBU|nr:hypothetical protein [Methanococcoides burtonii]ABE51761.1 Hypothetical protein Mbur_0805 [Methanococcoides burtonii DSM 6242]